MELQPQSQQQLYSQMKHRSLTPKTYSIQDLKTTESHSNFDQSTPMKVLPPALDVKLNKPFNIGSKPKPIPAKVGKIVYKCGCVGPKIQTRPAPISNALLKNSVLNKRFSLSNKHKSSDSRKLSKSPAYKPKPKRCSSLSNILKRINRLCEDYEDLVRQDTQRSRKFSVIKYVPKQVIKPVDRVKKVERPIEHKIVKVKKIPREVVKYKEVEVEVPVRKEELVFVDPEPLRPEVRHININKQVAKELPTLNPLNQRMKADLNHVRSRIGRFLIDANNSKAQIQSLKSNIEDVLARSKSAGQVPVYNEPMVLLQPKYDVNTSITTANLHSISDENPLIRSKSQPLKGSVFSYKSRMLINGKQQQDSTPRTFETGSPIGSESLICLKSSPQLIKESQVISSIVLTSQTTLKITRM